MSDLAERLDALSELNEAPIEQAALGLTAYDEADYKRHFLNLLRDGNTPPQAARQLGKTSRWFRKFRSTESSQYDGDFTERYEKIMEAGGEYQQSLVEHAREALLEAAKAGNVRAIEKILMAYDTDFQFLRPVAAGTSVNIENFRALVLPNISNETLEKMIEEAKSGEMKALGP